MPKTQAIPEEESAVPASPPRRHRIPGVTWRSILFGLVFTILVDWWVHYCELIMSGKQGHSAVVNTSIPVGPFFVLFVLTGINILVRAILPSLAFSVGELLVVYIMMTTSCVLSSSGELQFIVPTIAAPFHYATQANGWASFFFRYIPHWMAQSNSAVLKGFYNGHTTVPVLLWLPQIATWVGIMVALASASLCVVAILRQYWVDRERLTFPTVALPLALLESETPIFKQRIFWIGAALPFAVSVLNCVALNYPSVPQLNLRANLDIGQYVTTPPWNAIGYTPISLYPFVVGIAYLIPVDVTFSCWFFYLVTKIELVMGSSLGWESAGVANAHYAVYPYIGHQGAGAFLALTIVSLWLARGYLKEVWLKAIGKNNSLDDSQEPMSYRAAFIGLGISCLAVIVLCSIAGMRPFVALILVVLGLVYIVAGTRVRAETGNAWLFGPDVDVDTLMTRTFGSTLLSPQDLTILAFMRPAVANFDMRCIAMPHQMDAFKMAQDVGVSRRSLVPAIAISTILGLTASFLIALALWHSYGAEAKTDAWRTSEGRVPFDNLVDLLKNPSGPDWPGIGGLSFGFLCTTALMLLRMRFVWWPLHPVGYTIANTGTMSATWLPFFVAWAFKALSMRYGGIRLYRMMRPFFLGLIAGDLVGGGFFDLLGAFTHINVYPINW
jgi:hypothetical protein